MTDAIETVGLSRVFDQRSGVFGERRRVVAVDEVSLRVAAGSALGIVGESGCGKSTLARIMLGLLAPSGGTVQIDGRSLAAMDRRERARLIQPVFQDPMSSLNPRRRVGDIVAVPLAAHGGIGGGERRRRVMAMLERVGLSAATAARFPAQLSGGQRQRVAIARALVIEPRILICDEPTSALDVSVQAQILNLLAELRAEFNLTLVFISHNLAVVEHIADEVAVMYLGRIVEQAEVRRGVPRAAAPVHARAVGIGADAGTRIGHPRRAAGRGLSGSGQHSGRLPLPPALPDCHPTLPHGTAGARRGGVPPGGHRRSIAGRSGPINSDASPLPAGTLHKIVQQSLPSNPKRSEVSRRKR